MLGVNVGKVALADLIHAAAHRPHQVAVTRLQVQQEKELDEHCAVLDEASGAVPHLDESTDRMEAATDTPAPAIPEDSEEAQPSSEEEHTTPSTSDEELTMSTAAGEDADVPMPSLDEEQRKQLVECTRTDPTLKVLREHADKGILGHCWKDGLLLHEAELSNLDTVHRIVVPSQFRRLVLELAHERAGHLSITKMRALVAPMYTWPGIHRDVCAHAITCKHCQVYKRATPTKAPNQPMPVISEPFKKLAVDLVGPFPRSKHGFKYILTGICLASRYPEAIPIRDMSAATVAEGLFEMFSRTGVPRVLLSDQGTQFMSALVRSMCARLGVTHITTSTYHPQSNGFLERLHGTLVPMLRKVTSTQLSWPEQIKYVLFALRGMPARNSGFSPFEIVFGRKFPSLLTLLFDNWSDQQSQPVKLSAWLDKFDRRVEAVRDSVRDQLSVVQAQNKCLEQQKKLRTFSPGDKVLLHACGLPDKLAQAWEGPYVVKRRIGLVNYELDLGSRSKRLRASVVHVNNKVMA